MHFKDSIRLCFVNTTKTWGGGERWHYENAVYASENGFDVSFICSGKSVLSQKLKDSDVDIFQIDYNNIDIVNPLIQRRLIRFFRENKIQVVVFNGPRDLKVAGRASVNAGVPVRMYRRGLAKEPHAGFLNRYLFKNVTTDFIINSEETGRLLFKNHKLKKFKKNVHLLYNGLSAHTYNKKAENKVPVIGNASRFVEQKGLHYLIEMAALLKKDDFKFKLIIAGEGPQEKYLKQLTKKYGLDDLVEFPGFIKDVASFVSSLDVYACSSVFEGFGFSIAEAMHAACPVVCFDISSNPELISHGKTGYLVKPFDVKEFTEKIIVLLKDKKLRKEMGEAARRKALVEFCKEKQQGKFCDIIRSRIGNSEI